MATLIVPLLICLLGLLAYAFADNSPAVAKISKIGFALFCIGAFWCTYASLSHAVHL